MFSITLPGLGRSSVTSETPRGSSGKGTGGFIANPGLIDTPKRK